MFSPKRGMFAYATSYGKLALMGEIETERLRLMPLSQTHVPELHELSIDPEVRRYLFVDQIIPRSQVEDMVAQSEDCFARFGIGFYALFTRLDGSEQFAGFAGLRVFENDEDMEMLVGISPRVWGRGIGGEAATAVLRQGFDVCGLDRIIAATDTPNQRSVRMLQKLGMSFRERRQWHGLDTMFYELTATEFGQ